MSRKGESRSLSGLSAIAGTMRVRSRPGSGALPNALVLGERSPIRPVRRVGLILEREDGMTDHADPEPAARPEARPPRRTIVRAVLRAVGSTAALVAIYYLLPLDRSSTWVAVTMLAIGLAVLIALVVFQVRWILRSRFPGLRGAEALATSIPLFLLLFASTYVVMVAISAGNFSEPLTRTDALYFTVTVFSTVGFGDITAKTEAARLVVTGQMIVDLVAVGLAVKVIVGAVKHGRSGSQQSSDLRIRRPVTATRRYASRPGPRSSTQPSSLSACSSFTASSRGTTL